MRRDWGTRGSGLAGEGARVPPSTCPTIGNHLAQLSLAMLSYAMGMVTPVAAGVGALIEERGGADGRRRSGRRLQEKPR